MDGFKPLRFWYGTIWLLLEAIFGGFWSVLGIYLSNVFICTLEDIRTVLLSARPLLTCEVIMWTQLDQRETLLCPESLLAPFPRMGKILPLEQPHLTLSHM